MNDNEGFQPSSSNSSDDSADDVTDINGLVREDELSGCKFGDVAGEKGRISFIFERSKRWQAVEIFDDEPAVCGESRTYAQVGGDISSTRLQLGIERYRVEKHVGNLIKISIKIT